MNTRRTSLKYIVGSILALFAGKSVAGASYNPNAYTWRKFVVKNANGEAESFEVLTRPLKEGAKTDEPTPVLDV